VPPPFHPPRSPRERSLLFLTRPDLWPHWPFLPLVRRRPGAPEFYGVAFDALRAAGLPGYSATVFLSNLFELPPTLSGLLALPRECFDAPEEILDAGWSVD
jgi:hypothetical protein